MAESDQSLATTMMLNSEASFAELIIQLQALRALQETAMNASAKETSVLFRRSLVTGGFLLLGCVLIAGVATVAVRRSIMQSVLSIRQAASRLKDGDLSLHASIAGTDEIALTAQAMSETVGTLRDTIRSVNAAAGEIDAAIGEIAAGNHDLSLRTERQAGHLQRATSDTALLVKAVNANTEGARAAASLAALSKDRAESSGNMVARLVEEMHAISESSKKVNDITSVIDSIAFQTNILALNAAVEAARAGEQGRGFAVVASEVRSLAQRSATAAAEIKRLIANAGERVEAGGTLAVRTGSAMQEVVSDVLRLHGLVDGISQASGEQNQSVSAIAQMLAELDTATQQNAALVEQAAAAASSMRQESARLVAAVGTFRTDVSAEDTALIEH